MSDPREAQAAARAAARGGGRGAAAGPPSPTPLERARAIAAARERGVPLRDVAREHGLSAKQARRYERLAGHPPQILALVEEGRLPLAHAQVLAEERVADPRAWWRRWRRYGWSARELRREVQRASGRRVGGRRRVFLRREGSALRFYAFRISRAASRRERERLIHLLEQALDELRSW